MEKTERPGYVTDEHLEYLDELRESGITNMWGAAAFLERDFDMGESEARNVLGYWMDTFGNPLR